MISYNLNILFLEVVRMTTYIPTYKHISRNLYLYPNFKRLEMSQADKNKKDDDYTYEPESGEGDYYISERPWSPNCFGTDSHAIKIRVEHATKYTMASMGKRYCFAFGNFIKIEYEKYKGMNLSLIEI